MQVQPAAQRVVIGMDPHKRSATIEVMTGEEVIVGGSASKPTRRIDLAMVRDHGARGRNQCGAGAAVVDVRPGVISNPVCL